MDDALGDGYTDGHKAFLQAILARGTITFSESKPILAAIFNVGKRPEDDEVRPEQIQSQDFANWLDRVAQVASLFDYEIRSAVHQTTKERVYAIVNTAADPQTQLATTFLPDELSFVKRLLDAIFDKYNTPRMEVMALTSMQAMKLARPPRPRQSSPGAAGGGGEGGGGEDADAQAAAPTDKGLKHSEAESVLSRLTEGGWLDKSRLGFYRASQRALLELRPWLVETFNDPDAEAGEWQRIKFCIACKDLVTVGLRCAETTCTLRLHDGCQEAFWRVRGEKKCPQCSTAWTGKSYVGERAVTTTDAYNRAHGTAKAGGRRGGRGSGAGDAEEVDREEDQDQNEDGSVEG